MRSWRVFVRGDVAWRVFIRGDVAWRVFIRGDVAWRVFIRGDVAWRVFTRGDVAWRVFIRGDVAWRFSPRRSPASVLHCGSPRFQSASSQAQHKPETSVYGVSSPITTTTDYAVGLRNISSLTVCRRCSAGCKFVTTQTTQPL